MELNTKIGRRINRKDISINKLENFISLINFVYVGRRNYLEGASAENYIKQTAIKLINSIGGFDPNLVNGIINGTIKPKKAYIPIYDFNIAYEYDRLESWDIYYDDYESRRKKIVKDKGVRQIVDKTSKSEWYLPNTFDGLIKNSSIHSHIIGLSTYTYNHVDSFEKENYYFYNHPAVLNTKNGIEEAALKFGKNEMKTGIYKNGKPRNLKIARYGVYLFEIMVFEYSSGSSSPAYIAINVFDPSCYTYKQNQGSPNEDYTGKGVISNNNNNTRSTVSPTSNTNPKEKASSLVNSSQNTANHPAPTPEELEEFSTSLARSGIRKKIERERNEYMDAIWKKHNTYNTIFYICFVLSVLITLIINGFSKFHWILLFFGLIIGARIFFIKKFTFEKKDSLTSYINEELNNMKQVLKTYRLLLIFGVLASILFSVLIAII